MYRTDQSLPNLFNLSNPDPIGVTNIANAMSDQMLLVSAAGSGCCYLKCRPDPMAPRQYVDCVESCDAAKQDKSK